MSVSAMKDVTKNGSTPHPIILTPPPSPRKQKSEENERHDRREIPFPGISPKSGITTRFGVGSDVKEFTLSTPPASPQKARRPRAGTCLTENRNGAPVTNRRALSAGDARPQTLKTNSQQVERYKINSFQKLLLAVARNSSPQFDGPGDHDDEASSTYSDTSDFTDLEEDAAGFSETASPSSSGIPTPAGTPSPKRTWRSKDAGIAAILSSPSCAVFSDSDFDTEDLRTPLTNASPAVIAFPFPIVKPKLPFLAAPLISYRGSPLRHSQWSSRGRSSPVTQTPSRTPDRFIPARRSPNSSTESFLTSKPTSSLTDPEKFYRRASGSPDPFSRQLRRSSRLTGQLRALRQSQNRPSRPHSAAPAPHGAHQVVTIARQVSDGAVWQVGGGSAAGDSVVGVSTGHGGMLGSGTNAPLYTSKFLQKADPESELETYERRLAAAIGIDQSSRILGATTSSDASSTTCLKPDSTTRSIGNDFFGPGDVLQAVLDAPQLRDDFYCSLLAYSETAKCLAVALGNFVHLWSEENGVDTPDRVNLSSQSHITSLAFSSTMGGHAILAVGRADGRISLWSLFDDEPRFEASQPSPVACLAFRPSTVKRPSLKPSSPTVPTEELLIGDEAGHVYLYSVEWPSEQANYPLRFHGGMTLLARITVHTQQVCGLAWSSDGEYFATGGNDNACFLFETKKLLYAPPSPELSGAVNVESGPEGERRWTVVPGHGTVLSIPAGREKHKWSLNAAVKAIAFCPWQRGLVAIGGGSNDRCIHFYHTVSGAGLATIDCAAQITSLVWSKARREIAATFGFAQPDHPFRIAVFAWPSCDQVVAIPWYDESRALYAIAFPGGPSWRRENDGPIGRSDSEGCLVVAASDAAIRFHEVWSTEKRKNKRHMGILGGSDILESFHGIEKDGPEVR